MVHLDGRYLVIGDVDVDTKTVRYIQGISEAFHLDTKTSFD